MKEPINFRELYNVGGLRAVRNGISHMIDHWKLRFSVGRYLRINHTASAMRPGSLSRLEEARREVKKRQSLLEVSTKRLPRSQDHFHPKPPGQSS